MLTRTFFFAVCCICVPALNALGGIVVNFDPNIEARFRPAFADAAATWEQYLTGYQDPVAIARSAGSSVANGGTLTDVVIDAVVEFIDGPGMILGSAGPNQFIENASGDILATDGRMRFDTADADNLLNNGTWEDVILHEMGHVLGFGTLWQANGVYVAGSGEYLGAAGNAFWQSEFGQTGNADVELDGGPGTADGHWNESFAITDNQGRALSNEIMTGFLHPNPYISNMTIGSFQDIGFTVQFITAVPEPTSLAFAALGCLFITRRRNRKAA